MTRHDASTPKIPSKAAVAKPVRPFILCRPLESIALNSVDYLYGPKGPYKIRNVKIHYNFTTYTCWKIIKIKLRKICKCFYRPPMFSRKTVNDH